jgi:hypothetical protein
MGKLGKDADRDAPTLIGMGNLGNMLAENKARTIHPLFLPLLLFASNASSFCVQRLCWLLLRLA